MILENLNFLTLVIFAPTLVLVGILGFLTPVNLKRISTEPAYNVFHIVCGIVGAVILLSNNDSALKTFNLVFGLINIYQFAASHANQFPVHYFKWTRIDNIIHLILGLFFLIVAFLGQ